MFVAPMSGDGAFNMALDGHLLRLAAEGRTGFAFRVYSWSRACVSFGRMQKPPAEADLAALAAAGVDTVRRPTGGRAVWHEGEITYCVVAGAAHSLSRVPISESLSITASVIVNALRSNGVAATTCPADRPGPGHSLRGNPCFSSHGRSEIVVDGRKLVGSAQARSGGAFLEHGSILLRNDQLKLLGFLRTPSGERMAMEGLLARGACCLDDLAPGLDAGKLESDLMAGFEALGGCPSGEFAIDGPLAEGLARSVAAKREEASAWMAGS